MESPTCPAAPDDASEKPSTLTSGHTWLQKFGFALSLVSPLASGSVLFLVKDVYILELGADVQLMGLAGAFVAAFGPASYIIGGYCMEKELLARWFPWESWGRRAPWFLTHCAAGAVVTAALYLPPTWDPVVLCIWYLTWGSLCAWLLAVQFTCFESSRAEIYPTKEERSETESLCKITSGMGNGLGLLPQLIVAANVSSLSLSLAGVTFFLVGLISLLSVPVLRQARQSYNKEALAGCFLWEYLEVLKLPSFRLLCTYRFFDGAVNTLLVNGALYYFTFVSGLNGTMRSVYITATGVVQGAVTVMLLPVWTIFFRKRRPDVNQNKVCAGVLSVGLTAPLLLWSLRGWLPTPIDFMVYFVFVAGSFTGQTYWRSLALCWIVDEDCHAKEGRRREAVFVGCVSLASSVGRAVAAGALLNALSFAGLEVSNCAELCRDSDQKGLCRETCEQENFEIQDPAVATCIEALYFGVIPLCQAIACLMTFAFPIHGDRLRRLYERQEQIYKVVGPGKLEDDGKVATNAS